MTFNFQINQPIFFSYSDFSLSPNKDHEETSNHSTEDPVGNLVDPNVSNPDFQNESFDLNESSSPIHVEFSGSSPQSPQFPFQTNILPFVGSNQSDYGNFEDLSKNLQELNPDLILSTSEKETGMDSKKRKLTEEDSDGHKKLKVQMNDSPWEEKAINLEEQVKILTNDKMILQQERIAIMQSANVKIRTLKEWIHAKNLVLSALQNRNGELVEDNEALKKLICTLTEMIEKPNLKK